MAAFGGQNTPLLASPLPRLAGKGSGDGATQVASPAALPAYHALFYTHLYLADSEAHFTPWPKHRKEYQFMGPTPWPPHAPPQIGEPYDKEAILEYLAFCQRHVTERAPQLDLEAASGFGWLPFGKLELQFYNIRHLQQHTGELMERLGARAGIDVDWVGMKRPA